MRITEELLKEKGACRAGIQWFEEHFPDGCELDDETINSIKDCPPDFAWWFYNNVQQDLRLYKLCGVNGSNGVNVSNGVNGSNGVNWSDGVNGSNGVNVSDGVNRSNGVNWSDGVNRSGGVNWSDGVNRSNGVNWSFGILNCRGVSHALFLADCSEKYTVFGKEVSEEDWYSIQEELYQKLGDWRPAFNDIQALYLAHGSDWKSTPVGNAEELSRNEAWAGMPQEAIDFVRSLPQFDADMFEKITGIRTEPLRKGEAE